MGASQRQAGAAAVINVERPWRASGLPPSAEPGRRCVRLSQQPRRDDRSKLLAIKLGARNINEKLKLRPSFSGSRGYLLQTQV
jgi:hypothetical protein